MAPDHSRFLPAIFNRRIQHLPEEGKRRVGKSIERLHMTVKQAMCGMSLVAAAYDQR